MIQSIQLTWMEEPEMAKTAGMQAPWGHGYVSSVDRYLVF